MLLGVIRITCKLLKLKLLHIFPLGLVWGFFTLSSKFQTVPQIENVQNLYLLCHHIISTKWDTISRYFPHVLGLILGRGCCSAIFRSCLCEWKCTMQREMAIAVYYFLCYLGY